MDGCHIASVVSESSTSEALVLLGSATRSRMRAEDAISGNQTSTAIVFFWSFSFVYGNSSGILSLPCLTYMASPDRTMIPRRSSAGSVSSVAPGRGNR